MNEERCAGRLNAHPPQEPLGRLVQDPVKRIGCAVKPIQRRGRPKSGGQRLLNGKPFWPQLPHHDLQECGGGKSDREGDRVLDMMRSHSGPSQRRPQQGDEHRLRQPAQSQARHRDAQLRRAEIGREVLQYVPRQPRPLVARRNQRVQLRGPQLDKCKLRGHEEAVDQDNGQDTQQMEGVGRQSFGGHNVTSPKITLRMSCRLMMPASRRSGPRTTACLQPVCCIRRNASSRCRSSGRKNAGCR